MKAGSIKKSFGLAIRERRLQMGVSQEAFAEIVGIHRTYIGSVERGERNISLDNIVRIAEALGITPSDLLADAEKRPVK
ncbi:MAG: helix-turn-helix domain-containing protein [Thermoleophilia bacterium]